MIKRTLGEGVFMICVGTDLNTSKQGIELAQQHDGIWASVGLHPNDNLAEKFDIQEYEKLLKENKVVALGEVGLDYYRTTEDEALKFQKDRLEQQLEVAQKESMPVILHCRDAKTGSLGQANKDMVDIIHNYNLNGAVVHSFTGSLDEVKKYLELGIYIGFNGIITFARQYDEVVRYVPNDRLLIETDAPYLAPEPYRGKRNESLYIKEVVKKLAEIRGETENSIIEHTSINTKQLFDLKI